MIFFAQLHKATVVQCCKGRHNSSIPEEFSWHLVWCQVHSSGSFGTVEVFSILCRAYAILQSSAVNSIVMVQRGTLESSVQMAKGSVLLPTAFSGYCSAGKVEAGVGHGLGAGRLAQGVGKAGRGLDPPLTSRFISAKELAQV